VFNAVEVVVMFTTVNEVTDEDQTMVHFTVLNMILILTVHKMQDTFFTDEVKYFRFSCKRRININTVQKM